MPARIETLATKVLLQQLVTAGELELEGDPEEALATLVAAVTTWLAEHGSGSEIVLRFAVFLEQHPNVAEIYADEVLLAEKLAAWSNAARRFAQPVEHHDPALDQQILDNLDDDAARLVYADILQQHGDPLGELITRHAANNQRAMKRLLGEHAVFFFGPVEEYLRLFKIEYHLGFIRSIAIVRKLAMELEWPVVTGWLLDRPIARFLEHIVIGPIANRAQGVEIGIWHALLAAPRRALRSIALTSKHTRLADSLDLALLGNGNAPRVEDVRIEAARATAEPLDHPTLRHLELSLDDINDAAAALADSDLPALEELAVTGGWRATARTLWPRQAPALRRLRLRVGASAGGVIESLIKSSLPSQLEELEISSVDAVAGGALVASADHFSSLKKLSIPDHTLSGQAVRELARVLPVERES